MNKIIIFGTGEGSQELLKVIIDDINRMKPSWEIIGFIDKDLSNKGEKIYGYPVLGTDYDGDANNIYGVCGVMDNELRKKIIHEEILGKGFRLASLIHPSIVQVPDFIHDSGVIMYPGSNISYNVKIGKGVTVNYNCVLGHDLVIDDYTYIGPSVTIAGQCTIGELCTIGAGSTLLQGVSIGNYSTVGIGTTIINNIDQNIHIIDFPRKIESKKINK
jgi:sugar O-acyltransferase (sialic acid O-acetyltransferase NeuD family)